ncbi:MAG: hypothetical protein ACR2IE_13945 [Candidatus Sumerlaeaceae bacterium]
MIRTKPAMQLSRVLSAVMAVIVSGLTSFSAADIINSGGGRGAAGATTVLSSIGEPAIGLGTAGTTQVGAGFIYTLGSAPGVVTGLTASDGTFSDRIRLNWTAVAGATEYMIYRTLPAVNNPQLVGSTSLTTFDDLTVPDLQVYQYTVFATNADGVSPAPSNADTGFRAAGTDLTPVFTQSGPFSGWVKSGIESGPESAVDPGSVDDVDVTQTSTELSTIVSASTSRYRILGWTHSNVMTMPTADKAIRGQFYIFTSNPGSDVVNKVPAFRVRLQSEGAYVGSVTYNYGNTGNSGPDADNNASTPNIYTLFDSPNTDTKAGNDLRPSNLAAKPSLYRVDFDPVNVPAAVGTKVVATFESFAFVNPAAGTLSLTEASVGTYPVKTDADGTKIFTYRRNATALSQGVNLSFGGFNAENNFSPGYRQKLFAGGALDSTPASQLHTGSEQASLNTTGITVDTVNCPTNVFGVSIVDVTRTPQTAEPRIQAGKLYRARFYATSNIPTSSATAAGNRQGGVRFRVQTGLGAVNCYQDFNGAWSSTDNSISKQIGVQALPGTGSQNPEIDAALTPAGNDGGWYTVMMPTPLDPDIRANVAGTLAVKMPAFNAEPGPTVNAASAKKIVLGVDLIKQPATLTLGPGAFSNLPFAQPNQAKISITAIDLYEINSINDGGYNTTNYP